MTDLFFTGWRKWGALFSIMLALAVPFLMTAKAYYDVTAYPVIKIGITGYDPRDLLYGHYMLFQFDWNWQKDQPDETLYASGGLACLCLGSDDTDPSASILRCDSVEKESCAVTVRGRYTGGERFDIGHNRYFVPETRGRELETLLRDAPDRFRMGITVPPSGRPRIKGLYIDDMPVEDYLRQTPMPAAVTP